MNKTGKRRTILLSVLSLFISWQGLTQTGFCYQDLSWPGDYELVARYKNLSSKINTALNPITRDMQQEATDAGCCLVEPPWSLSLLDIAGNSVLLGRKLVLIAELEVKEIANQPVSYSRKETLVNACATKAFQQWRQPLSKDEYLRGVSQISKSRQQAVK